MIWLVNWRAGSLARRPAASLDTARPHRRSPTQRLHFVANIKSQLKRIKQNDAAHERNKSVKSALRTSIRRFREAADAGDGTAAKELAAAACRRLDKAASAGVIHKNQAANKKSAIAKRAADL